MSGLASDYANLNQDSLPKKVSSQSGDTAANVTGFPPIHSSRSIANTDNQALAFDDIDDFTHSAGLKDVSFAPPPSSLLAERRASINDALDPPKAINLQAVKDMIFDTTPAADGQILSAPLQAPPEPMFQSHGIASLPSPSQSKSTSLPVLLYSDNSSSISLPNLSSSGSEKRHSISVRQPYQSFSQLPVSNISTELSPSDPPITWSEFIRAYSQGNWDPSKIPKRPNVIRRESSQTTSHQSRLRNPSRRSLDPAGVGNAGHEGYSSENDDDNIGEQIKALGFLPAPKPANEAARRRALYRLNILKAPRDPNFERIAHLAKLTFGVETALISLVDDGEQWFKNDGLNCNGTLRQVSFCAHALLQRGTEPLIVTDATKDWRFAQNPLVTGPPNIRFYAGAPLRTSDGYNLGTFCLIDSNPKEELLPKQRHMLKEFASIIVREMELHSDSIRLKRLNQMQDSVKEFAQICLERDDRGDIDKTMKQLYETACKTMKDTLGVDGVCILDLLNMELVNQGGGEDIDSQLTMTNNVAVYPGGLSALAEEEKGAATSALPISQTSSEMETSIDRSTSPFASGAPIQVLGEALPSHSPEIPPSSIYASLAQAAGKTPGVNPDPVLTPAFIAAFLRAHPLGYIYQNAFPPSARHFFPLATKSVMLFPIYNVEKEAFALLIAYTFDDMFQFEDADLMFLSSIGILILGEVMKHRVIIADRAKGTFISNISHELRTPLHGILASLELIQETPLTSAQVALLETIESCGKSLIEVINHVLDFSKLGANARRSVAGLTNDDRPSGAALERVNLVRVIEEVVESCYVGQRARVSHLDVGSLYDSRSSGGSSAGSGNSLRKSDDYLEGVEVILEIEPRLAGWIVKCEKGGVRRVLMNLIGNSLKFTTTGYVHVSVTTASQYKFTPKAHHLDLDSNAKASEDKKISLVLTVADTGKGISPQFLQSHLFHPFTQEDPLHIGTGLGMSIVKMIVENMGGKIEVRSEVGIGTEIRVFLGVEQCEMDQEEARDAEDIEVGKVWAARGTVNEDDEKTLEDIAKVNFDAGLGFGRPLRVGFLGIDANAPPGKRLLQDTLQQYASEWMNLQVCEVADADVVIVDEDLDLLRVQLSEAALPISRFVVTVKNRKHEVLDELVSKLRQNGCIVEILNKPYGPIKLARAVTRVFEEASGSRSHRPTGHAASPHGEVAPSSYKSTSQEWSFVQPSIRRQDSEMTETPATQGGKFATSDSSSDGIPQRPVLTRQWGSNRSVEEELRDQIRFETASVSSGPHSVFTRRHSDEKFAIERRSREKELAKRPPLPPRAVTERRYVPSIRSPHHSRTPSGGSGVSGGSGTLQTITTSMYHRSLHDQLLQSMNKGFGKGTMHRPSMENLRATSPGSSKTNWSTSVNAASSPTADPQISPMTSSPSASTPSSIITDPLSPTLYPAQPLMRPPKVLVVEDNQVNRMILGTFLRKRGIEHEEAHNGEVGVRKFKARLDGFDIILMDIQMPTMDGNAATSAIRQIEAERAAIAAIEGTTPPPRARVFALTGLATAHDKKKAFASGVDSFLTKPVSLKVLGALFERWGA